jgi:hypothetical protein
LTLVDRCLHLAPMTELRGCAGLVTSAGVEAETVRAAIDARDCDTG